ncbi:hypothetical protein D0Z66_20480 (plasmid) [Cereibacter sphaeroides]|nr:hypothetical protein D0Z66_20480 [Cereibacter sphaeroides]
MFLQFLRNVPCFRQPGRILVALIATGLLMAACSPDALPLMAARTPEFATEYRLVSDQQRWIGAPAGGVTLERRTRTGPEQLIALPNHTVTAGDNYILAKAREDLGGGRRFSTAIFSGQIGPSTLPFRKLEEAQLRSRHDGLGPLVWSEVRQGSLYCVLAFRRTDTAVRMLPGRARSIDLMMRNCVTGDLETALAPIGDASLLGSPVGDGRGDARAGLMLSPLAGPKP